MNILDTELKKLVLERNLDPKVTPTGRDMIPTTLEEIDENGDIHIRLGYRPEDWDEDNPLWQMDASTMSLQTQIDAGVPLNPTQAIAPHSIDAARDTMVALSEIAENINSYNPPSLD